MIISVTVKKTKNLTISILKSHFQLHVLSIGLPISNRMISQDRPFP